MMAGAPRLSIIAGVIAGVMSCGLPIAETAPQAGPVHTPKPEIFYRRNLKITVNGKEFDGVGVVPKSAVYQIEGKSKGNMDLLAITTCHRDVAPAYDLGHSFKYTYQPRREPGDMGPEGSNCAMKIEGLDKKHGKHAWGFIDFEDPFFSLYAKIVFCGEAGQYRGVYAGQCREGLSPQVIEFSEAVEVSPDKGCETLTQMTATRWELKVAKGECVYLFRGKQSGAEFRMTTMGYESAILEDE